MLYHHTCNEMLLNFSFIRREEKVVVKQLAKWGRSIEIGKSPELGPWPNSTMHLCDLQHISNLRISASPSIN